MWCCKKTLGLYTINNIGYIIQFPECCYDKDIKPGDRVWAEITEKNPKKPVYYAKVISVNGTPHSNKTQQ